jgi:hypothetical protein
MEKNIWTSKSGVWGIHTKQALIDVYREHVFSETGKVAMIRTRGNNVRRKNREESV